jgi:hypothetical protein
LLYKLMMDVKVAKEKRMLNRLTGGWAVSYFADIRANLALADPVHTPSPGAFGCCGLSAGDDVVKLGLPTGYVSNADPTRTAEENDVGNDKSLGNAGGGVMSLIIPLPPAANSGKPKRLRTRRARLRCESGTETIMELTVTTKASVLSL